MPIPNILAGLLLAAPMEKLVSGRRVFLRQASKRNQRESLTGNYFGVGLGAETTAGTTGTSTATDSASASAAATPSAAATGAESSSSSCIPCYEAKHTAYQKCKELSASDRDARKSCFDVADAILASCLTGCSSRVGVGGGLKTAAVLGAGAFLLYKILV